MKKKIRNFEDVEKALLEFYEAIKCLDGYVKQIKDDVEMLKAQIK